MEEKRVTDSIITVLESSSEEERKSNKSFFNLVGFEQGDFQDLFALVDDIKDQFLLFFKKEMRRQTPDNVEIMGSPLFIKALLTEEGKKYIRLLEEHVSSSFMVCFFILRIFDECERELSMLFSAPSSEMM